MIDIFVSVIMPSFNSSKFIVDSINSVVSQSFKNWELIIIDDCSCDDSVTIIKKFCEVDSRVKLFVNDINFGVAEARNRGIQEANYPLIAFIDSDDIWVNSKLEIQVKFMLDFKAAISFSQYYRINEFGLVIGEVLKIPEKISYNNLLKGNSIAMSTSMVNTKIIGFNKFEKIGHEDYYFWLSYLRNGFIALGINENLCFYRVHSNSLSFNKFKAVKFTWYIYRKLLNFNIFKSFFYFIIHSFKAIQKRL